MDLKTKWRTRIFKVIRIGIHGCKGKSSLIENSTKESPENCDANIMTTSPTHSHPRVINTAILSGTFA